MLLRRILSRIVAPVAAVAIAISILTAADGHDGPAPPLVRPSPNIGPFQGMGVWVDLYDDAAWANPAAAVGTMAANGVHTLYLETSNFNRPFPFVDREATAAFIDAAHADGIEIVAWYLPGFVDPAIDLRRSKAAVRFTTGAGNRFDGYGLDIEAPDVADATVRTARLLKISAALRTFAGEDYPLGAIIPSPRGMVVHRSYWPAFPYGALAEIYDAIMPMSYFTWHHPTADSTHWYIDENIRIIRREVGSDQVPIHVIGGIAQDASLAQADAFVDALREHGVIGGSYYTYTGVAGAEWTALRRIPANPVESPAMPVPLGDQVLGNVPGIDTTHGTGVAYQVGGFRGDRMLTYDALDAQAGEITISVNGNDIATVDAGPDGDWTGPRQLVIPDDLLIDGQPNTIAFTPSDPADTWGVRTVALAKA